MHCESKIVTNQYFLFFSSANAADGWDWIGRREDRQQSGQLRCKFVGGSKRREGVPWKWINYTNDW